MFAKLSLLIASVALLVAASPVPDSGSQCNTANMQCCNSVQSASSEQMVGMLSLLGVVAQGVTGLVGAGCSPITAVGLGSSSW